MAYPFPLLDQAPVLSSWKDWNKWYLYVTATTRAVFNKPNPSTLYVFTTNKHVTSEEMSWRRAFWQVLLQKLDEK
ncbi:hypothetical protein KEM55_006044, partial [Ascosphaera atra]